MHNKKLVTNEIAISFDCFESVEKSCDKSIIITKSAMKYIVAMDFDSVNRLWDQYLCGELDSYIGDEAGNFLGTNEK